MNIQNLNQKIILQLGLFGALMGLITIMGWGQNLELFIWLFMTIASSMIIKINIKKHLFVHCILIGLSWGVDCSIIQALFFNQLKINNPTYGLNFLENYKILAEFILIGIGTIIGGMTGLMLWGIQLVLKDYNPHN